MKIVLREREAERRRYAILKQKVEEDLLFCKKLKNTYKDI